MTEYILEDGQTPAESLATEQAVSRKKAKYYLSVAQLFNNKIDDLMRQKNTEEMITYLLKEPALDSKFLKDLESSFNLHFDSKLTNFFMLITRLLVNKTMQSSSLNITNKEEIIGQIFNGWKDFYKILKPIIRQESNDSI